MPTSADAAFLIVLGLTGGLHCAGMCGPLACSYALSGRANGLMRHHLAYYGGRLLAYAAIGAILGSVGDNLLSALEPGGPVRMVGMWAASGLMAGGGLWIIFAGTMPRWAQRMLARTHSPLLAPLRALATPPAEDAGHSPPWRTIPLGMVSGVLPCGLMWAAELKAAVSGSALTGMALMVLFWAATSPSLYLTTRLATWLAPARRPIWVRLSGAVIVAMAIHLAFIHGDGG